MPEGHTIHRLAKDLNRSVAGRPVTASSPQGRFAEGAARLDGQECDRFVAYGKHLIGRFGGGDVLHVHLGLIGKFRKSKGEPRGAVRLRLSPEPESAPGEADKAVHWDLRGPMVCRLGTPDLEDDVASSVGPDPLGSPDAVDDFVKALQRRRIPIGAALLDQKIVAGIGNVYRAELLFLAGVDPRTPARDVPVETVHSIWDMTVEQLGQGVRLNRIVTVDPALGGYPTVRKIPKGERLYTYKRTGEPCRVCDTPIELLEIGGRKTWLCSTCQS